MIRMLLLSSLFLRDFYLYGWLFMFVCLFFFLLSYKTEKKNFWWFLLVFHNLFFWLILFHFVVLFFLISVFIYLFFFFENYFHCFFLFPSVDPFVKLLMYVPYSMLSSLMFFFLFSCWMIHCNSSFNLVLLLIFLLIFLQRPKKTKKTFVFQFSCCLFDRIFLLFASGICCLKIYAQFFFVAIEWFLWLTFVFYVLVNDDHYYDYWNFVYLPWCFFFVSGIKSDWFFFLHSFMENFFCLFLPERPFFSLVWLADLFICFFLCFVFVFIVIATNI